MPSQLPAHITRLLDAITPAARDRIWEQLCDTHQHHFRTSDVEQLVATTLHVKPKTAADYSQALIRYWLQPGNSDLVRLRQGLFGWVSLSDEIE